MVAAAAGQFRIDLHVHTRVYSPCAELLDPADLDASMVRAGLDGIVLAEHDQQWTEEELEALTSGLGGGRRVYRGVEVSSRDGHFVLVGPRSFALRPGLPAAAVVEAARREGAAIVLAHPQRLLAGGGSPEGLEVEIDAVEIYSSITRGEASERAAALARRRGWAEVAGSDAHAAEVVGEAFTVFPFLPRDERELAQAIIGRLGRPARRE